MGDGDQSLPVAGRGEQEPVKPEPWTEEVRVPWEMGTRAFLEPEEENKSQSKLEQGTEKVRVPWKMGTRAILGPEEENKNQSNLVGGEGGEEAGGKKNNELKRLL